MNDNPRIDELNTLAAELGIPLPYPAAVICELEDAGHLVNLDTGEVMRDGLPAVLDTRIAITAKGRAVALDCRGEVAA